MTDDEIDFRITFTMKAIEQELRRAIKLHTPMNTNHEGYAVILEEMDELWAEIKNRDLDMNAVQKEAIQVGAMAARFIVDSKKFDK